MELAEAVVRAERVLLLVGVLRAAAVDDRVRPAREAVVVREQRAAFAGGQDLRGLVAERAEVADAPGARSATAGRARARSPRRPRARAPGDVHDPVHVGHLVPEVHRHDRPRPFGVIAASTRSGSIVQVSGVDVDEHRQRAGRHRRVRGRRERERRHDHLVAPADAERLAGDLHRDGAVHHQDRRARRPGRRRTRSSKRRSRTPGSGKPPHSPLRTTSVDCGNVRVVVVLGPRRVRGGPDRGPAVDRERRHRCSFRW